MELKLNEKLHGFTVLACEPLPEIDGTAYTLLHDASGARLLYLANDDTNKAFSIAFKTPPANSTGVFHILEHSVLCGSDRYPLKEPFVNLLKSSMQTFLNAMTFSDKTMYPVASTNDQDLLNLTDIYMDAVLHPAIYHKRAIFEQEGWHYELAGQNEGSPAGSEDAAPADPKAPRLALNGVVYNEMKGALSDPDSVLYDELQAALFPQTAYRFESGGAPREIPDLTYEEFLDEHARHYRLDNSYLTLYGNLDLDRMLAFLDERHLAPTAAEQATRDQERKARGEAPLLPHELLHQEPVKALGVRHTMNTAKENACAGMGFVVGDAEERTRVVACDILLDAIAGSNEAPLKRALLDSGLADDVQAFLADSVLQPFAIIELRGLRDGAAATLYDLATATLRELAGGKLDHGLIEASLSHAEFVMRERDYGVADGVALSMTALAGWLYDDTLATSYLHYESDFAFLRKALSEGYFEELITSVFLENDHLAQVEIVPATGNEEALEEKRLSQVADSMQPADFQQVSSEVAELRRLQEEPDSPEALATLPHLSIADVAKAPDNSTYRLVEDTPLPCLRHSVPTHGIAYMYRYFDARRVSFEDLPYLSILASVLGKLDTASHTAAELDTLENARLGNLSFSVEVGEHVDDPEAFVPRFVVGACALSENVDYLNSIPREIMLSTSFADTAKIKDVLQQRRIDMEQGFAAAGHTSAIGRVASYYQLAGVAREQIGGIDFYRFLKGLLAEYDQRADQLAERLSQLAKRVFVDDGVLVSFAGSEEDYRAFWQTGVPLDRRGNGTPQLKVPAPVVRNEAFIVPTDVCFAAQGYDHRQLGEQFSGAWQVAARALSFDYLWNEIRVKGGAYGAGFQAIPSGNMRFYSYRDPRLDETLARFQGAANWIAAFSPTSEEMDDYVISTTAGFDTPLKPRQIIRREDADWFSGRTPAMRDETRAQIVGANMETVRSFAEPLRGALGANAICAFGNRAILESSHAGLETIDLLGE